MTPVTKFVRSTVPWSIRFEINRTLLDSLIVGDLYLKSRPAFRGQRIVAETNLIIEGFPRSANTYAKYAAEYSLGPGVRLAGHAHSAALVAEGAKLGLPAIVLVREPDATVASLHQFMDGVPLRNCYRAYARFHSTVLKVAESVQISSFESILSDFGGQVGRLNERFGTSFSIYQKTPSGEAQIRAMVEADGRRRHGGNLPEKSTARPSDSRTPASQLIEKSTEEFTIERDQAQRAYEALQAHFER